MRHQKANQQISHWRTADQKTIEPEPAGLKLPIRHSTCEFYHVHWAQRAPLLRIGLHVQQEETNRRGKWVKNESRIERSEVQKFPPTQRVFRRQFLRHLATRRWLNRLFPETHNLPQTNFLHNKKWLKTAHLTVETLIDNTHSKCQHTGNHQL